LRVPETVKVIASYLLVPLAGVCFLSVVLWATGWAALLPEPVRSASAKVAFVAVLAWTLIAAVVLLVVGARQFVRRLRDEMEMARRRREVRDGRRSSLSA
jgi:hypothetical protein